MAATVQWAPMETAPRDGAVLCLSDGEGMITGAWDGTGWILFPDEEVGGVDPRCFVPKLWMRVTFSPTLPGPQPNDVASGIFGL